MLTTFVLEYYEQHTVFNRSIDLPLFFCKESIVHSFSKICNKILNMSIGSFNDFEGFIVCFFKYPNHSASSQKRKNEL